MLKLTVLYFIGISNTEVIIMLRSTERLPQVKKAFGIIGIKNWYFSSVPTRMILFTCKKYDFLIERNRKRLMKPSLSELR